MTTDRPTTIAAEVPPEPADLRSFRDRDGDLWDLNTQNLRDGSSHRWRCIRRKVPTGFGSTTDASWMWVLINVAPIRPVEWADSVTASPVHGGPTEGPFS